MQNPACTPFIIESNKSAETSSVRDQCSRGAEQELKDKGDPHTAIPAPLFPPLQKPQLVVQPSLSHKISYHQARCALKDPPILPENSRPLTEQCFTVLGTKKALSYLELETLGTQ